MLDITKPDAIEAASLAIIDAEVPEPRPYQGRQWEVVRRLVHTTADFDLLQHVRFTPGAVERGVAALKAGARIVTDTDMARMGIPLRRLEPLGATVRCLIQDPAVKARAEAEGTTRARAAVDAALDLPEGPPDIWVVGNAPTALLRLLERLPGHRDDRTEPGPAPALVVGMPVGFVNAAESKEALMVRNIPSICIQGRKGGSALAAATVNALAIMALAELEASRG